MPTYKDEKTGLWYCKFVYTDWTGTKKQKKKKGFRLQKEAKQYELDFLSKTSNSCDMLFSDMVEIYMDYLQRERGHHCGTYYAVFQEFESQ